MASKNELIEAKKCITPVFRVSFPNVFRAESYEGSEPKFGLTMIFDKEIDLRVAAKHPRGLPNNSIAKIVKAAIVEKWGADKDKWPKKRWNPIRDGDTDNERNDESLENALYIRASSKTKPGLINARAKEILVEDEFYAGCYAQAEILAYAFDKAGKKGVGIHLLNIQKVKDGKPMSGRRAATEVFGAIESDDDEELSHSDDDEEDDGLGF